MDPTDAGAPPRGGRRRGDRGRARTGPWWRWTRPGTPSITWASTTPQSGVLFAGDAVGVKLPDGGVLRPATPPPDFDLDLALDSLQKFAARRPSAIALAHYGLLESPEELLAEADDTLRQWAETAEAAYREGADIAEALSARFDAVAARDIDPAHREKLETR